MPAAQFSPAIQIQGLQKSFKKNRVLQGFDLNVPAGTIFALLGANGSGKTTTINILTTLLNPDAGTASVAGFDVITQADQVRARIGVTGQFAAVDGVMTGEENLGLMAKLAHLDKRRAKARVSELIELFDLTDAARKPASTYSGGMQRRLDLAMSLVLSPSIVFLDEPTTGVDPRGRAVMWEIVRNLAEHGTTIFLTTQYLEEADQLADRIAVIDAGKIIAEGTPAELKLRVGTGHLLIDFPTEAALSSAAKLFSKSVSNPSTLQLSLTGGTDVDVIRKTLARLDRVPIPITNLRVVTPDLDDVFFALTGAAKKSQES